MAQIESQEPKSGGHHPRGHSGISSRGSQRTLPAAQPGRLSLQALGFTAASQKPGLPLIPKEEIHLVLEFEESFSSNPCLGTKSDL